MKWLIFSMSVAAVAMCNGCNMTPPPAENDSINIQIQQGQTTATPLEMRDFRLPVPNQPVISDPSVAPEPVVTEPETSLPEEDISKLLQN